jgi:cytochrome c oxidase subunit 3
MKKKSLNFYLSKHEQQPFHLVDVSPWPIMLSIALFSFFLSFLLYFNYFKNGLFYFLASFFLVCFYLSQWFLDIIVEATFEGHHTLKVQQGIKLGMCLFIVSEIMFFFSFFWSFFHSTFIMSVFIGDIWPPVDVFSLDPWAFPSLNTIILLSSGITITWSHRSILSLQRHSTINGLIITIFYGILFTFIQYYEYTIAPFCINDSIFGSLFFMLTGFHGIHVFVGSIFLVVCLIRLCNYHFTSNHHVGYECCIWYWHFVDVVWLFLFVVIYIWGGN